MMTPESRATILLRRMSAGDAEAGAELYELLYQELHERARALAGRQQPGNSLQATALIGEAWLRLGGRDSDWADRAHFLRTATRAMRHALVDHARARATSKRGGGRERIPEAEVGAPSTGAADELLALHEALEQLEKLDPDLFRVAELRVFGGLTHEEIAGVLQVSSRTVERTWKSARSWLRGKLDDASTVVD